MPLEIVTVPCLADNYAYLVKGPDGELRHRRARGRTDRRGTGRAGLATGSILITHHHHDHVGGVEALRARYGCEVLGPKAEHDSCRRSTSRLPTATPAATGEAYTVAIEVPGHTLGHIAYHFPNAAPSAGAVFTADSLMALGCGRVFEGTPEMMWQSLSRLAALPPATLVYSGHEYTAANARFALTIEPDNRDLISRAERIDTARAGGRAHRALDPGRGTGHQPLPARRSAAGQSRPRHGRCHRCRGFRRNSGPQGPLLAAARSGAATSRSHFGRLRKFQRLRREKTLKRGK